MKSSKILSLLISIALVASCVCFTGFMFWGKKSKTFEEKQIISSEQKLQNPSDDVWCVTFQLVWNQFMDKITDGKPVKFVGGNPKIADELNKREYSKEILSENSYYIEEGKISLDLKKKIEKQLKKQFNEKSDILDLINWNTKDSYLFYSMLKKEFNFLNAFDKLTSDSFNGSLEKVKYFGIDSNSDKKLKDNVVVLFYDSDKEYAVKLLTKENENIILYRTDKAKSFTDLFNYVVKHSNYDRFTSKDNLKIPNLVVDKTISYNDLTGKQIEGSDYVISQALQTIKFNLDEKGGKLKSEAAIAIMKTALMPEPELERNFYFDKPFTLFLIEEGKDKPYYAMNVNSTDYIVKE